MAALSGYPDKGMIVRGDPLSITVNIRVNGADLDVSGSDWRAQVRSSYDAALIVEFTTSVIIPAGGTVPSTVVMELSGDDAAKLKNGMVFDLEELDQTTGDTIRTWWICTGLKVQQDVSRDDPGPITNSAAQAQMTLLKKAAHG